jgi:YHS domain-containing protein
MRNVLGFATAFAFVLLVGGLIRAAALSRTDTPTEGQQDQSQHEGHGVKDVPKQESKAEEPKKEEPKKEAPKKEEPKPEAAKELENTNDPVSGKAVGAKPVMLEHKGWKVRFESEANRDKFLKKPIRYYAPLSLEPAKDGKLLKVDASKYEKAAPATCAVMGGDIEPDGDVFILHRGFKVFFCCWSGCGDEFIADPAKYYDHYGLAEKDGKLVRRKE